MSTSCSMGLLILSLPMLIKTLVELNMPYQENKQIKVSDGAIHKADVAVADPNGHAIGFVRQGDGAYQVVSDCKDLDQGQIKKQKDFVNSIKKRYAYNMVVAELQKQGYSITEEKKVENNTVRLTARRWKS